MKIIHSTDRNGPFEIAVDDEDYQRLSVHNYTRATKGAVFTSIGGCTMHLTQLIHGKLIGHVVDHIDRNKLNFQRSNLRFVTNAENSANQGVRITNTSGFKGVSWNNMGRYWQARLTVQGHLHKSLGHETPVSAALAYDTLVQEHSPCGVTNESLGLLPPT